MSVLDVEPDGMRHQADLFEDAADEVQRLHVGVPEVGGVNGPTETGLRLVEHRAAGVAESLRRMSSDLRHLAALYPLVDDAVAQALCPRGS